MLALAPKLEAEGYATIFPFEHIPRSSFPVAPIGDILLFLYRTYRRGHFFFRCFFLSDSDVIVVHPQSLGFSLFFHMLKHNSLSLYVMDNSFFCICSYNTHPVRKTECLDCLGEITPHPDCIPSPCKLIKYRNIRDLKRLKNVAGSIKFLAQNHNQRELLKRHFGGFINVSLVGLTPGDISTQVVPSKCKTGSPEYQIVFHGTSEIAKGILYFVALAVNMPEYSFLVPDKLSNLKSSFPWITSPPNLFCIPMRWETGLCESVESALVVVNPSMWSAPIEGALLKSFQHANNIATVQTRFGYESELPPSLKHIRLSPDPLLGALELRNFLTMHHFLK